MRQRTFIYDIEVYPNYFGVTIKHLTTGQYKIFRIYDNQSDLADVVRFFSNSKRIVVGYYSHGYDDQIIAFLLKRAKALAKLSAVEQAAHIFDLSKRIIENDERPYMYQVPYRSIDLMKVVQVGMNRPKTLKLIAVNLKWNRIQDLPFPPHHQIQANEVDLLEEYNVNDVDITEQLYLRLEKDIKMRRDIGKKFGMGYSIESESESGIGKKILSKMYQEATGLSWYDFKDSRTPRDEGVPVGSIIHPKVKFATDNMNTFVDSIRDYKLEANAEFGFTVKIGNTSYTMAMGGLHSEHPESQHRKAGPGERLVDVDVRSYYPYVMLNCGIRPAHLRREFLTIFRQIVETRVQAKAAGDKVTEKAMKIAINAAFGSMGFAHVWLYDPAALYAVTINGELFLLMLIEKCEQEGIEVFYANTDGITVHCKNEEEEQRFHSICKKWEAYTGFELESTHYLDFFVRDVNNYLVIQENGTLKEKGSYNENLYKNVTKAFSMPVVARAVREFLCNKTPVEDTILEHDDLHDFCMAQKVGKEMEVYYRHFTGLEEKTDKVQKVNRYLVGREGGFLTKRKPGYKSSLTKHRVLLMNDAEQLCEEWGGDPPVDRWFYIREAWKLLEPFGYTPSGQQKLF